MKIRINTPKVGVTADLSEEQIAEIIGITLDYAVGLERPTSFQSYDPTPIEVSVPTPAEPVPVRDSETSYPARAEFKGFLYLQCEECKKFKGFMPKTPISRYRCDCGHITPLKNMKVIKVDCKCGSKFKYLTNTKDSVVSIDCINCGYPVDLEYHERRQEYITIKDGEL